MAKYRTKINLKDQEPMTEEEMDKVRSATVEALEDIGYEAEDIKVTVSEKVEEPSD